MLYKNSARRLKSLKLTYRFVEGKTYSNISGVYSRLTNAKLVYKLLFVHVQTNYTLPKQ